MGNSALKGTNIYAKPARPKELALPAALHSGWHTVAVEKHPDLAPLRNIETAHRALESGFNELLKLRQKADPAKTRAAHFNDVEKATALLLKRTTGLVDRTRADAQRAQADVDAQIQDRLNLRPGPDAAEIRAALRSMSADQRSKALSQMIETGDGPGLAAVLNGHPVTHGISADQLASRRTQFERQHAADLVARRDAIKHSADKLFDAVTTAIEFSDQVTDPGSHDWAAEQEEAAKAAGGFQSAVDAME